VTVATHRVVINDEDQYSIIAVSWVVPAGWHDAGFSGSDEECGRFVQEAWTDMRPRSLRRED
jgi:MbtH protein